MNSNSNPVILITGAGKGIGRALALEFARSFSEKKQGASLFLTSRTESDLKALCLEISEKYPSVTPTYWAVDLSTAAAAAELIQKCVTKFGAIHSLINNAGVGRFQDFGSFTEADYDFVINTNLKAQFFLTQGVFQLMKSQGVGDLFFVTSTAAEKPYPESALYCMSKFGQKGLLEVLRLHARKAGIRVCNIMPGPVFTPMWGPAGETHRARMMMPEDVASTVVQAYFQPRRTSVEEIVFRPQMGDIE